MKPVVVNIHKLAKTTDGNEFEKDFKRSEITRTKLVTTEANMKAINEKYKETGVYYELLKENTKNYKSGLGKDKTPIKEVE